MFKRLLNAIARSRQAAANEEIARILCRTEYNQGDYHYILARLNRETGVY